jgi:hypothetical protein
LRVRIASLLVLAACTTTVDDPDDVIDPGTSDVGKSPYGEVCGNSIDDDGDGRTDEDCAPSLFGGVFAPETAEDPALEAIEKAAGRALSVAQTYHTTSPAGIEKTGPDLAKIFARGMIPHLNIELAYTRAQLATPTAEPMAHDFKAMGDAIARAVNHAPGGNGRILLTFGAEMNGNWTSWGCLSTTTYIALYRAAYGAIVAKLDEHGVDRRRVRWVYGPDSRGSAECPSAAAYYPGHAFVDLLGLSAYRKDTQSVDETVLDPMARLFDGVGMPHEWRRDRFVLLQTGSRAVSGRDAWITELWDRMAADPRAAGILYFDAADWAVAKDGVGWSGLTHSLGDAPLADKHLDGTFLPHFWDVNVSDAGFGEIQALRDAGVTEGCSATPRLFCPSELLDRAGAAAWLGKAFKTEAKLGGSGPLTERELADAITAHGGSPVAVTDAMLTRARAAVVIARGAKLVPRAL